MTHNPVSSASMASENPVTPASICLLSISRFVFYTLIIGCMIFPHELERYYTSFGFMKVYAFDVAFLAIFFCIACNGIRRGLSWQKIKFNKLVAVYVVIGVLAGAVGFFVTGNPYRNVFGDFRRSFFYFLAYFVTIAIMERPIHLRTIKAVLLVGASGAIIKGMAQLVAGGFVVRRVGEAAHILSHFEATFSTLAVYWAVARIGNSSRASLPFILLASAGIVIIVISNFRACWIALLIGLTCTILLSFSRYRKRLVRSGGIVLVVVIVALGLLWFMPVPQNHLTIGKNLLAKANIGALATDQNIQWRMNSYTNALKLWKKSPLLGRGLGEVLTFETSTSTGGIMTVTGHRVHNSYLWFLMSTGLAGFLYISYFHLYYVRYVMNGFTQLKKEQFCTMIALISFYAAMMTIAVFDVFLESAPPNIILSTTMAVTLLIARDISHQKHCHVTPV